MSVDDASAHPKPVRRITDRWSRTVLVSLWGILAVLVIAVVALVFDKMDGGTLAACLMAIRECVGLVAGRGSTPGKDP